MNFPFGKASHGSARPRLHKFLSAKPAQKILLAVNDAPALLAVKAPISVHLPSLPDSLGSLQEMSRKWVLLQAACLPEEGETVRHLLFPPCFFCIVRFRAEKIKGGFVKFPRVIRLCTNRSRCSGKHTRYTSDMATRRQKNKRCPNGSKPREIAT